MGTIASQITNLTIVYSTAYSGANYKTSKLRVTGLCAGNSPVTGEFPAQMSSNAENVSIWWRHHVDSRYSTMRTSWLLIMMVNKFVYKNTDDINHVEVWIFHFRYLMLNSMFTYLMLIHIANMKSFIKYNLMSIFLFIGEMHSHKMWSQMRGILLLITVLWYLDSVRYLEY